MADRSSLSLATPQLAPLPKTVLESKKERLFGAKPAPAPQEEPGTSLQSLLGGQSGGSTPGFGDRVESSLYSSGGSLADMGKSISNAVLGTEFDDSVETGWSQQANPETRQASAADKMAGISFDQRENSNQELQGVMDTYVEDGLASALWEAIPQAGGVIADSASSLVELGAGAAATAFGGAGAAVLARRAQKTYETISKIKDSYDKAKEANRAVKAAASLTSKAVSESSKASLLTADIVQQTKVEYEQETGEKMSPERLAGTTLVTMATTVFQPGFVTKFYLPKSKGFVGKTVKEKYDNEMKQMAKYLDQGTLKAVANRVGAGLGAVFKAGGAEAAQEYAQTWAGILSVKMDPEEAGGLIASAYEEFGDKDNQNEAAIAGILGTVAGGGIRAASAVPTTAAGAVADVGVSVGNKIVRGSYNSARDRLSSEDQEADIEERKNIRAAAEEVRKESGRKVEIVGEAKTYSDITDEAVKADMTARAEGRDLSDPKVFKAVSNSLLSKYRADSKIALTKEKAENAYVTGKKVARNISEGVVDTLNLTDEDIQKMKDYVASTAEATRGMGKAFVNEIKNFESSATIGIAKAAVDYISETTKSGVEAAGKNESVKKSLESLRAQLDKTNSVSAARSLADSLETNTPDNSKNVVKEIRSWADKRERDQLKTNRKNDSYVGFKNLGENVKAASQKGAEVVNPRALSIEISEAIKGSIEDLETLQSLENAFENYKSTEFSKTGKDAIGEAAKKNIARKLARVRSQLESKADSSVKAKAKSATDSTVKAAGKAADWAKPAVDKLKKAGISTVDSLVDRVTNEDVFVSEDTKTQRGVIKAIQDDIERVLKSKEGSDKGLEGEALLEAKVANIISHPEKSTFNEKTIKGLSKVFKTSNPDYLMAIFGRIFPPARDPDIEKVLRDRIETVLKDSTEPNTQPTRQKKKSVDVTTDKDQNGSKVVVEEDGAVFRAAPDIAAANAKLVEILGNHICKV